MKSCSELSIFCGSIGWNYPIGRSLVSTPRTFLLPRPTLVKISLGILRRVEFYSNLCLWLNPRLPRHEHDLGRWIGSTPRIFNDIRRASFRCWLPLEILMTSSSEGFWLLLFLCRGPHVVVKDQWMTKFPNEVDQTASVCVVWKEFCILLESLRTFPHAGIYNTE